VEILHEDPNVNYDCQIRTRNNGNQNPWTDFYEVERVAVTDEPTVITQTITAPDTTVTSQRSVEVQVEVYCYGPSNEEPHYANIFSDGWIAQGYWSSTLTYEYPTQEAISGQDLDNDGLTRAEEQEYGTNPSVADTDNDGLEDGEEVTRWDTDPTTSDTDGDGLDDGEEVNEYGTDPTDPHSDGDGLEDGEEVSRYDTNPTRTDTDGDGIDDGTEVEQGTDPTDPNDPPEEDDTTSEPEEDTNTESTTNPDSDNDNQVSESTSEDEDTGSSEEQFQRGFLTNNPDSSIAILNSPANLTAIGFFLSILGILLPMVKEG
jgi:hypothetical protein